MESEFLLVFFSVRKRLLIELSYRIVASLVRAQPLPFLLNIFKWLLVAIPATWTNSWLSYVQNKLALAYRTRLTNAVMKEYLGAGEDVNDPSGKVYYKLGVYFPFPQNPFSEKEYRISQFG